VYERPAGVPAARDREPLLAHELSVCAVGGKPGPRPIEIAVAQDDRFDPTRTEHGGLQVDDRVEDIPEYRRAASYSGSSSVFTQSPTGLYAWAMLCTTSRRALTAIAAARTFRVPTRRSWLVISNSSANRRGSTRAGIAVSWCTTTSGAALSIAANTASLSNASAATASAPIARTESILPAVRTMPVTSWPQATSDGSS
jgi:hypothetical protein